MRDKNFLILLTVIVVFVSLLGLEIQNNQRKLKRIEKAFGFSSVLVHVDGADHSAAIHIVGDWDCHIQVDNTCYTITPEGLLVPTKVVGFKTDWGEYEIYDPFENGWEAEIE